MPGDLIRIELRISRDRLITVPGRVVYGRPDGRGYYRRYGVGFMGLDRESASSLNAFLSSPKRLVDDEANRPVVPFTRSRLYSRSDSRPPPG